MNKLSLKCEWNGMGIFMCMFIAELEIESLAA